MNTRRMTLFGFFLISLMVAGIGQAQPGGWPRTLPVQDGSVTVYPLQVEGMDGDLVRFRAALAYRETDDAEPVFGAGWFVSKVDIDRTGGVVHPVNLVVSDTRFPAGTVDLDKELSAAFARQSQDWDLDFPLSELVDSLAVAEREAESLQNLNTAPPKILYRDHPALLVSFDGDPVLRKIENSDYQAVINTSYPLIYDGRSYYLGAADGVWYRADNATGPYRFESSPPPDIVSMVDASKETGSDTPPAEKVTAANAPEIVVVTEPSELIVTEGPAAFVPLVDDLLVLSNTSDDVFMHISSQQYYIVLAGRWYHAGSLNGPWTFSPSDQLPPAFANIPAQSEQADARVYVAGTEEAREAVLDAQIPQTAAVERGPVDLDVTYDGDPSFEPVEGTEGLAYANNTGSTVLQSDRQYYLVEDGVWYVSSQPNGPWEVSAYRPVQVASISPRSPVYNVKYVYIYDSTPDVVYVGYTPGYVGSYVYYDTIVYGTGWYYRPWVTPYYYYPRYTTWGFNVNYNPWYGWSFGLSWGWGPFYAGYYSGGYWHHGHRWYSPRYSCWGPRGYRPRPSHYGRYSYGRGGYDRGYDHDGYRGRGYDGDRYGDGRNDQSYGTGGKDTGRNRSKHGAGDVYVRNENLYRDRAQKAKIADTGIEYRRGDKLSGIDRKGGHPVNKGQTKRAPVTPAELQVKAQVRDARKTAQADKNVAENSAKAKHRNTGVFSRPNTGSWQEASNRKEVRHAKASNPAPAKHAGVTGPVKEPGQKAYARSAAKEKYTAPKNNGVRKESQSRDMNQYARVQKSAPASTPQIDTGQKYRSQARTSNVAAYSKKAPSMDAPKRTSGNRSAPRVNDHQKAAAPAKSYREAPKYNTGRQESASKSRAHGDGKKARKPD